MSGHHLARMKRGSERKEPKQRGVQRTFHPCLHQTHSDSTVDEPAFGARVFLKGQIHLSLSVSSMLFPVTRNHIVIQ